MYDFTNRTISTERLLLRMFRLSDVEAVTNICNNLNVSKSTLYFPYPYYPEYAASWIETLEESFAHGISYDFAITDKATQELYGGISISHNAPDQNGEMGFWIGEPHWGKGYATEASKAIIQFAFLHKKYHKVFARHFATNPASGRVLVKSGMSCEGILIEHLRKDDKFEDVVHYGIINTAPSDAAKDA